MSYAPYPAYKDSGVPWLGQVPEGWEVKRVRNMADVLSSNVDKKTVEGEIPVRLCNYVDVYYHDKITDQIEFMVATAKPSEIERFSLRPGDVVITKDSESADDIGVPALITDKAGDIVCGYHLAIFRGDSKHIHGPYLFYAIKSEPSARQFEVSANGVTRFGLPYGALKSLALPLPPIEEQTAIARFLDEKTAEIDNLIAKKEELLRLLAEQRIALITHAVTKGFDPSAPMKPSGIDWLGDVPEGWEVKPFKREVWYQEGPGIMAVDFRDEGVPLLRIRNLKPGKVELEGCNFLDPDMAKGKWGHFQIEEGDRLISTSASTGLVSVVDADSVGAIPYTGIIRIRPLSDSLLPEFLEYFVSSELFFDQIDLLATGTTIQHFGPYHLNQMVMALPPVQEQRHLIQTLASDLSKISETKGMVETALDRLREYRTALITNAVTGKIKVA